MSQSAIIVKIILPPVTIGNNAVAFMFFAPISWNRNEMPVKTELNNIKRKIYFFDPLVAESTLFDFDISFIICNAIRHRTNLENPERVTKSAGETVKGVI